MIKATPLNLPPVSEDGMCSPAVLANVAAGFALRGYHRTIWEATGRTDPRDLDEIEDVMRHAIFHSTLDWQTKRQLCDGAREALEICILLGTVKA